MRRQSGLEPLQVDVARMRRAGCPASDVIEDVEKVLAGACGGIATAVDYDPARFEHGSEMPRGRDVSDVVEQVKQRLKQIEEQFNQHQRLAVELERLRDVVVDLEHAVVSRLGGGHPPAAKPTEPAKRPRAAKTTKAPARTPRGQNKAKILESLKGHGPMTASEIAKATGIPRATVSTTLTKLAKTGELAKAERGYTLPL
jgi:DNA-binding transcriptional ArsR family regulator